MPLTATQANISKSELFPKFTSAFSQYKILKRCTRLLGFTSYHQLLVYKVNQVLRIDFKLMLMFYHIAYVF